MELFFSGAGQDIRAAASKKQGFIGEPRDPALANKT